MSGLSSQPWLHQHSTEVQRFGTVRQFPRGLTYEARMEIRSYGRRAKTRTDHLRLAA